MTQVDTYTIFRGVGTLFYMVSPNESSFQHVEEVPQYIQQATPFFTGLMVLELVVGWLKARAHGAISDGITSVSAGMVSRLPQLLVRSCELTAYVYVWSHYRLVELPWDSACTWWLAFLGVDFFYYWVHRLAHEVTILWAAHQVHHSSEYFNLATALRQSVIQQLSSWISYLPLAFFVPPSMFAVHIQLNILYQFWIHTELIRDLGPLEWVLNTPSHHRVHHGRNPYCIDKNYGGVLIVWDRLFGTFAPETDKIVYGLVFPINTFEILHIQLQNYIDVWRRSKSYNNMLDKVFTFFKGPSWAPGKPWLGDYSEIPHVTGEERPHHSRLPVIVQAYVVIQFLLVLGIYDDMFKAKMMLSQLTILAMIAYILFTLTSLGFLIDQRPKAAILEMLRCVVMVIMQKYGYIKAFLPSLAIPTEVFVSLSLLYWGLQSFSQLINIKNKSD